MRGRRGTSVSPCTSIRRADSTPATRRRGSLSPGATNSIRRRRFPAWRKFLAQFESPLVLLLIAAGGIAIAVWFLEHGEGLPYEALTILAIVLLNALLGYYQEARAEEAVASLRRMTSATATVLRDGERQSISAAVLVPGDILLLEEGATVPADARVIESVALQAGEAALTGESVPVLKEIGALPAGTGIADRVNMVFAGTAITYGHGRAVVTATGMRAEVGRIAGMLHAATAEATPLQRNLDRLGKLLGIAVIAIAVVVGGDDPARQSRPLDGRARRRAAVHGVARGVGGA